MGMPIKVPSLEEGQQCRFLVVLEYLSQEEKLAQKCASKDYFRRMSLIWSIPFSDYHRVIASTQFVMLAINYFMLTQHWPITWLTR